TLTGLAPGTYTLVASYIGYQDLVAEVTLAPGENRRLDLELAPAGIEIDEVVVTGEREEEEEIRRIGVAQVSTEQIKRLPTVLEPDVFRSLQLLPGVKAASDFSSGLYIRGGGPDQTLILLDRTSVYNPSHFFGFFSTFNTSAIDDVQLWKGGFPAEYGGRLGSVIDVETRAGSRARTGGEVSLGLLASRVGVEGPYRIGNARGTWLATLRRSTLEPLLEALRETEEQIPQTFYFYDFNGRATLDVTPRDRFALSGYAGTDFVRFPFTDAAEFALRYGNEVGAFRYTRVHGTDAFTTVRLLRSRYFNYPQGEIAGTLFTRDNTIHDWAADVRTEWLARPGPAFGLELAGGARGGLLTLRLRDTFDGRETLRSRIHVRTLDGWGEVTLRPTPAWILTGGLRAAYFSDGAYLRLEPRLQLERKWGERVVAQAAYGRYTQALALISNEAFSGFDVWVTAADGVPPAYGDQYVLGLKTRPTRTLAFDVEVYYRTLRDLFEIDPALQDATGLDYADLFRFGEGYAAGVEVLLERRRGRLTGFLAYTLGVTRRKFRFATGEAVNPDPATGEPAYFSPKYDRRHDLAAVATYDLGAGWSLTGAFTYATGQAYTRPTGAVEVELDPLLPGVDGDFLITPGLNRSRLPAYHRFDLGVTKDGSFFGIGLYELRLQAINLYNRRNVWFYPYNPDDRPVLGDPVRMLPILPNVSLTVDF
ncbi:MAG: TonB-dependent receptor, partial [Rhodothermales bacterium]|nr:TonB-dependent receptor [Rhodothermales bacterium]